MPFVKKPPFIPRKSPIFCDLAVKQKPFHNLNLTHPLIMGNKRPYATLGKKKKVKKSIDKKAKVRYIKSQQISREGKHGKSKKSSKEERWRYVV